MPDASTIAIRIAAQGTQQFVRDLDAVGLRGREVMRGFLDSGKAAGEGFAALGAGIRQQTGSVSALAREAEKLRQAYEPQTDLLGKIYRLSEMVNAGLIKETTARQAASAAIEKVTGAKARENAALEEEIRLRQRAEQLRDTVNPSRVQDRQINVATAEVNQLANKGYLQDAEALAVLRTRIEEITGARARDAAETAKQAAATERLTQEANQLRASLDPQFRLQQELGRIEELRTRGLLQSAEATKLVDATIERSTGAKAREKAATEALAQSAERLRLALDPQYALSKRIAEIDDLVAKKHLDVATAARARAAAENAVNAQLGHGAARGQAFQNAGLQVQDIATQLASGTSPILTLSQQLPQMVSGFGAVGVAVGTAVGVLGALAVSLVDVDKLMASLGLRSMADQAKDAAEKVEELSGRTDELATSLGVVRDNAEEYTASLAGLSESQRGLFTANVTIELEKQTEALKKARDAIKEAIDEAGERARANVVVDQGVRGTFPGLGPGIMPSAANEDYEALAQRFDDLSRAFLEGGRNAERVRQEMIALAKESGVTDEKARELANAFIEQASAAERARLAEERLSAELRLAADPNDQAALAIYNRRDAMRDAAKAAVAYADVLGELRVRTTAATSEEDKFVARQVERAGIKDLGPVDNPQERQRIQADAQAATEAAARDKFRADQQLELDKKRTDFAEQLAAKERELTGAVDARTRAGERAAAQARAQVGDAPQLIEGARRQAIAEYDRGKAIESANKASTTASRSTEFLQRKEQEAEAAKREAAAIRGTAEETERALRYLKAENEYRAAGLNVQDASIKKRIEEDVVRVETIESLKAEQKARESVANAQKLQGRFDAGLGQAPATDDVTRAAVETANALAKARGDAAVSFEEIRRLIGVYSQYENALEGVRDPKFRQETLAQNIALHQQGEAGERAAKGLDNLSAAKRGVQQERDLTAALKEGLATYKQRQIEIKVDNELRKDGVGLSEQEREELRKLKTEQETLNEANTKSVKQLEESAERMAEVFQQPFKDLASTISNVASDTVLEFEQSGSLSGKAFAERFTEGIQKIGANLIGALTTAPINAAVSSLSSSLTAAMDSAATGGGAAVGSRATPGGPRQLIPGAAAAGPGMFGAFSNWAGANPLNAGLAGAAAGGLIGSVGGAALGRPGSYAGMGGAIGGAAGAALGSFFPGVGTIAGGLIGSALGSIGGSFFGGGDDNSGDNNMRQRFRPGQGVYYRESVQEGGEQNAQQVNQFMDQLVRAGKVFEQAGLVVNENFGPGVDLKVGSNSGITLNGKKYSSIEDALGAALQQLGTRGYRAEGESIQEKIARNTKATTVEGLAADFEFGKEYPKLISRMGETGRAIDAITERFEALKDKAGELGLSTEALDRVQDEQTHQLKEEARLRIAILSGEVSEYRQALENLSATYEKAKQEAKDLGQATDALNAARDRERERLEEEAGRGIRRLLGGFGSLDEAMLTLNQNFEEAKKIAVDLGISTEKLNAARDAERERLRAGANADLRVLMGEWDPLAQQLLQLRDVFRAANENAKDLGYTEERLMEARKRATAELIENRRREAEDAVASQAEQMRGFFSSILDPLRNAQSAFGGLQGIAAPSASIGAGLSEFRDLAKRAGNDDLSAIQQLPQLGQQLIAYARQYGASGADATGIIREVQKAYAEIENRYRDRQLEVMQSIPDAVIRTGADQIKAMQSGLDRVVEQLRVVEKTIRANKSGLLTAA